MSRSTADWRLRLEAADWVLDTPGGRRTLPAGDDPAAALETLAAALPGRASGLRVVLGDGWLRYLVVPWPAQVRSAGERRAYLAHRFQSVHGVAAPDWVVAGDAGAVRFPALACAAPAALVAAAQRLAQRCGATLLGLEGDFVASYNRWQGQFHDARGQLGALALVRPGRCTVGLWRDGAWIAVRSQPVGEHGAATVRRMTELLRPPGEPAGGVMYACGAAAAPDGWRLHTLAGEDA